MQKCSNHRLIDLKVANPTQYEVPQNLANIKLKLNQSFGSIDRKRKSGCQNSIYIPLPSFSFALNLCRMQNMNLTSNTLFPFILITFWLCENKVKLSLRLWSLGLPFYGMFKRSIGRVCWLAIYQKTCYGYTRDGERERERKSACLGVWAFVSPSTHNTISSPPATERQKKRLRSHGHFKYSC